MHRQIAKKLLRERWSVLLATGLFRWIDFDKSIVTSERKYASVHACMCSYRGSSCAGFYITPCNPVVFPTREFQAFFVPGAAACSIAGKFGVPSPVTGSQPAVQ